MNSETNSREFRGVKSRMNCTLCDFGESRPVLKFLF